MADEEQKPAESEAARAAPNEGASAASGEGTTATTHEAASTADDSGAAPGVGPPAEPAAAGAEGAAAKAVWEPFDVVLQAFGQERGAGVGTIWGESAAAVEGRFASWANTSGWRCTLQLVRAPEENVVVLVAQGPPLPGGRARVMVLGAFPPEFERDTLRAALEVGYGIGETWGPAEEPPDVPPAAAEPSAGPAS
ncbi:MAG TPA: hypothetical protein VII06_29550 [Chloroflexota bacterium]|jgi:hypothetical protein